MAKSMVIANPAAKEKRRTGKAIIPNKNITAREVAGITSHSKAVNHGSVAAAH